MKSKVRLYYNSLVNKEKNFVLDYLHDGSSAIEVYLNTLTNILIDKFEYVKQGLSVSIKINKNQTALEMVDPKDLNYVRIQNYEDAGGTEVLERPYYYFVISKSWKAKDTIELVLSMDTLNTFRFNYDYRLNAKTLTKRMHKDRFELLFPQTLTWRLIDFPEEVTYEIDEDVVSGTAYSGKLAYKMNTADVLHYLECSFMYTGTGIARRILIHITNEASIQTIMNHIRTSDEALIMGVVDDTEETFYISFTDLYADIFFEPNHLMQLRKIDFKSEDISAPVYKKFEDILYEQKGQFLNSWVLYYKNKDNQDNSPVNCFLTSDTELTFLTETGSNTITTSDVPSGKMLMFTPSMSGDFTMEVDGVSYRVWKQPNLNGNVAGLWCIGIQNNGGVLTFHRYRYFLDYGIDGNASNPDSYDIEIVNPSTIEITSAITELKCIEITPPPANTYRYADANNPFKASDSNKTLTLAPLTERTLAPSSTIDKTLSENLKIINVPYCPSQITEDEGKYIIESLWKYDAQSSFFKLDDFSYRFSNQVETNLNDIINVFTLSEHIDVSKTRYLMDSKLYHSDYYRMKFVYDSFTKVFPLEQIDYNETYKLNQDGKFKFTFIMSRNMVSKFLFQFNYVYKVSNEDYDNIVAVARNNEEVLYNSAYLNYVRTGFNFDVKSKERQEITGGVGIGLSALGFVTSLLLTATGVGAGLGVMGMIGSGISLASSSINYAKTTAQNEENIQRKLQETQRQAVSVLNADDYDLLYAYTQNKAKLCLYEISDNMKKVMDDLFYYCGYVVNQQMIPEVYSRYWFNFVQAGLIIEESANLNTNIEDDIKEKFEQGVTFLHYHEKFDFEQEMENWETSLLE